MTPETFVIRYRYPGTQGGKPVGLVYALDCSDIAPGVWSYTRDPAEATSFETIDDAQAVIVEKPWPDALVIPMSSARVIAPNQ